MSTGDVPVTIGFSSSAITVSLPLITASAVNSTPDSILPSTPSFINCNL